jgi:RHS repeat-associated protein
MSERKPERDGYDALIELAPWDGIARTAFAIVKRTYTLAPGGLTLTAPVPLRHDIRDEKYRGKWPSGSDFWPTKLASDVVVLGSAYAPKARRTTQMRASVKVGRAQKSVAVIGDRMLEWHDGRPRFTEPQPFESMPLDLAHAYGGHDPLVIAPAPLELATLMQAVADHPGAYPRNAIGKGYLVLESEREPVALPNLEDPDDLLTLERVFARDPRRWFRQPLPWMFAWTQPLQFPRSHYLGFDPWFPLSRELDLPEVARGLVPAEWRALARNTLQGQVPEPVFYQEASYGMTFTALAEKTPFEISGMHPERERLSFELPAPPRIEIDCEGSRQALPAQVLHVVITPDEERVEITWVAVRDKLTRAFMKGLHGQIPLALFVDGDRPIPYVTPEPIIAQVRRAQREGRVRLPAGTTSIELVPGVIGQDPPERTRDFLPPGKQILHAGIDVPTGRLLLHRVELPMQSLPFGIERNYASSMSWRAGLLGPGWSLPIESAVWVEQGWLLYRALDGREVYVAQLPRGELGLGEHVHHPIEGVTIVRSGSESYHVVRSDGMELDYHMAAQAVVAGPPRARLARAANVAGEAIEVRYDVQGRLSEVVLPSGMAMRFELDRMGRVGAVLGPGGAGQTVAIIARYEYDAGGRLSKAITGSNAHVYRYAKGLLVSEVRPGGDATSYVYEDFDGVSRCVAVEKDGETIAEVLFNPKERIAVAIDASGTAQSFVLDALYRVVKHVDVQGNERVFEHDAGGLVVAETDALGRRTTSSYDARGHLVLRVLPGGATEHFEHDAHGRLLRHASPDGAITKFGWSALGGLSARVDPDGASCVYEHDPNGKLETLGLPPEIRVGISRDPKTAAVSVRSALGQRRGIYDPYGRLIEVTDEEGSRIGLRWDSADRVRELMWGSGERIVVERHALGGLTRFSDGVVDVRMERDRAGRVVALGTAPVRIELRRDRMGRVAAIGARELAYDARGQLQREAEGEDIVLHERDSVGRALRLARSRHPIELTYADAGTPASIRFGAEREVVLDHTPTGWLRSARDGALTATFERDPRGRIVREESEDGLFVRRSYDSRGHLVSLDGPFGLAVRIDRDPTGAWLSLCAGDLAMTSVPDGRGYEVKRVLGSRMQLRFERDAWGACTARRHVWGDNHLLSETLYGVRGAGWISRIASSERGVFDVKHDWRGGLVALKTAEGAEWVRELDEHGNVYRARDRSDRAYDASGRLLHADGVRYAYDELGRRVEMQSPAGTTRYRWSSSDRLSCVELPGGTRVRFVYDPLDRLRERVVEVLEGGAWNRQGETRFLWDGAHVLTTIDDGRPSHWIRERGVLVAKLEPKRRFAVVTDPTGAVLELIDETGNVAWRAAMDFHGRAYADVEHTSQPWRWDGHWEDPITGLQHTLLREYDPIAGVYLTPSPLGVAGGRAPYAPVLDPLSSAAPLGAYFDPYLGSELPLGIGAEVALAKLRQLGGALSALPPWTGAISAALRSPQRLVLGQWADWDPLLAKPAVPMASAL